MSSALSQAKSLAKYNNELEQSNVKQQYNYNKLLAEQDRSWQERMANSAHQREIKDLKAAGLNPVLSITGGTENYKKWLNYRLNKARGKSTNVNEFKDFYNASGYYSNRNSARKNERINRRLARKERRQARRDKRTLRRYERKYK